MDSSGYSYADSYELLGWLLDFRWASWAYLQAGWLVGRFAGWLGWRVGWPAGQLVGWPNGPGMYGLLVGCSVVWLVSRLVGWPAGWLAGMLVD